MYDPIKENQLTAPQGGYLFLGDEDYTKNAAAVKLRKTVMQGDPFAEMNTFEFDGGNFDFGDFNAAVTNLPVFSERKFVSVRNLPQSSLTRGKDTSKLELFYEILAKLADCPNTILLVYYASGDADFGDPAHNKPSAFYKNLAEYLKPVNFDTPQPASLRSWITRHFNADGIQITTDAVTLLLGLAGMSMYTLAGEIEKLTACVKAAGRDSVTAEDVKTVVSVGIEDEDFALSNALTSGSRQAVFDAVEKMELRREEPIFIAASIGRVVCNMSRVSNALAEGCTVGQAAKMLGMSEYPARLAAKAASAYTSAQLDSMVEMCLETDRLLKSTRAGYAAIDRLVCRIT